VSTSLLVGSIFSSMFERVDVFNLRHGVGIHWFVVMVAIVVPSTATFTACGWCG